MRKELKYYIGLFILVILCGILMPSCSDNGTNNPLPSPDSEAVSLTMSPTTLPTFETGGGTLAIEVTCNTDWNAVAEQSWCTISPSTGSSGKSAVELIVAENPGYDERNTLVTFKAGTLTKKITLVQKQKDVMLLDSSEKMEVEAEGGTIQIKLRSNISYNYTIPKEVNWLHEPSKTASRNLKESIIELEVDENPETEIRQAVITITGGEFTEEVTVYQYSKEPQLILSKSDYVVSCAGDEICIELKSNSEYIYELPEVDWIKESESRAMSTYTHYIEVLPNESYDNRTAQIKFVNIENGEEEYVTIEQMKVNAIVIAQENYRISSEANYWELAVNTNVEFEAMSSADWLKIDETNSRGLVEKKLYLSAEANVSVDSREATVTLNGEEGLVQTIHIVQMGKTNRIKLVVKHEETTMMAPYVYSQNIFGTTDWGDGTIENFTHQGTHTYKSTGPKTTTFDIYGADALAITELNSISSLVIYVDKDKNSSVEDVEIDQKEWD